MLEPIVAGAAIVALLWGQRTVRALRAERRFRRRFPARADGIVIGAETRTFEGTENRAILLLHGYNDSPYSLAAIAQELHGAGWTVHVPLLPGHGRSLEAFASWTSEEMLAAVREAYAELRARNRTVVVGGLSMGGALACWLGAEADPDGVVLYAPMLFVPRTMQVAVSTARLWSVLTRYLSGRRGGSIVDPDAQERMISYGSSSRASLEQLERISTQVLPRLGFVHAPVLVIQSEEDNRLPHDQSIHAIARIGSSDKTVIWTRGAGHVITVDHGWPELAQTTIQWLDARFPASAALPPTVPAE